MRSTIAKLAADLGVTEARALVSLKRNGWLGPLDGGDANTPQTPQDPTTRAPAFTPESFLASIAGIDLARRFPAFDGANGRPTFLEILLSKWDAYLKKRSGSDERIASAALTTWIAADYVRHRQGYERDLASCAIAPARAPTLSRRQKLEVEHARLLSTGRSLPPLSQWIDQHHERESELHAEMPKDDGGVAAAKEILAKLTERKRLRETVRRERIEARLNPQ